MPPLAGRWIFLCKKVEFHLKDGVCQGVYHPSGALPSHAVVGWRAVGIIGPPSARQRDAVNVGECIIFAKHGEVFYTPPIDHIKRVRKSRPPKDMYPPGPLAEQGAASGIRSLRSHSEPALVAPGLQPSLE